MNPKIVNPRKLFRIMRFLKERDKRIVTTNGCFDILHRGHVDYLRKAKSLGHVLVVAVNSDEVVRKLKGKNRPVNDELSRAEVIAALGCVDFVTIFRDRDPVRFIRFVKPNVHVKAADYSVDKIIEYKAIKSYGGKLALLDFTEGFSTTGIIERMRK
ncbi:MAG: D-glycero-beta-D-manno-heptose 1-phosphate adenylyltransferase [archaeon]